MVTFLQAHPLLSVLLGTAAVLAIVGLWYVIAHHLRAIVITLICSAGAAAGAVVFWRGVGGDLVDLIAIGVFLMVIFPVFWGQAIRRQTAPVQVPRLPGIFKAEAHPPQPTPH